MRAEKGKNIPLVTHWQHLTPVTVPAGIFQTRPQTSGSPTVTVAPNSDTVTQKETVTPRQQAFHRALLVPLTRRMTQKSHMTTSSHTQSTFLQKMMQSLRHQRQISAPLMTADSQAAVWSAVLTDLQGSCRHTCQPHLTQPVRSRRKEVDMRGWRENNPCWETGIRDITPWYLWGNKEGGGEWQKKVLMFHKGVGKNLHLKGALSHILPSSSFLWSQNLKPPKDIRLKQLNQSQPIRELLRFTSNPNQLMTRSRGQEHPLKSSGTHERRRFMFREANLIYFARYRNCTRCKEGI